MTVLRALAAVVIIPAGLALLALTAAILLAEAPVALIRFHWLDARLLSVAAALVRAGMRFPDRGWFSGGPWQEAAR